MTPQERQLLDELFDRLASLERKPRDPEAERAIAEGLARAPHAIYALVQTVLIQEEALRRADERIRELEGEPPREQGGFLDDMRDSLFGGREPRRGSVPSVRPDGPGFRNVPNAGMAQQPPVPPQQQGGFGGGSFLGTAAASAAGVIGGALLLDSIRSMMGGADSKQGAFDQSANADNQSPWGEAAGGDLGRQAGVDNIGSQAADDQRAGLFDTAQNDADQDYEDDGVDFGGGDDSDLA